MNILIKNLHSVQEHIQQAAESAKRDPKDIHLLAVSKQQPAEAIRLLCEAGQTRFGENYVQEALVKMKALSDLPIEWHYIGHLQANKTRDIAEHFSWVHTIDRESIAKRLHDQRPASLPPLQVCIQVNFAQEEQKAGVDADEVLSLAKSILEWPRLQLRGLMVLPPDNITAYDAQLKSFQQLAELQSELQSQLGPQGISLDTLSMGMTHDFKAAIEAGATIVRIGTAIFGARN